MESVAKLKNSSHSPRKMRLLADLVRGERVEKALSILKHHPKIAYAKDMEKVILSAMANWENKNEDADAAEADLFVSRIWVDEGRVLKRIQPAPQGRAHRIRKRSNHITVVLDSHNDVELQEVEETESTEEKSE